MADGDYLPANFSWLQVNELAGSSCPMSELELRSLVKLGIQYIVTLSPECLPPPCLSNMKTLKHVIIAVADTCGGSLEDFRSFFRICDEAKSEKKGVLVHCRKGWGRTGTFLAAFLVKYKDMDIRRAIETVRSLRPHSIETRKQELSLCKLQDASACKDNFLVPL